MNEMNFLISDSDTRKQNIKYIVNSTFETLRRLKCVTTVDNTDDRVVLTVTFPEEYSQMTEQVLLDKVADVIAVNYKYEYFIRYIRTGGLDKTDYEMLIAALIAADLEEDKRYVLNGNISLKDFSIDGYFNFRLKPLKEKWAEIVTYIPTYFTRDKLNEFISYIVCEKKGKRAIVYGDKVYDSHYNRMIKSLLINKIEEGSVAREIVLCGFSEVELSTRLTEADEKYLISFYGDKIFFKKEKIT